MLNARAQQSDLTLIYRLTDEEAETIYREGIFDPDESYFHTYIDSFHHQKYTRERRLSPGYYIFARADWEQMIFEFKDLSSLSARLLPDRRDLAIQVFDSLGQAVSDANIRLDRRPVNYQERLGAYRLPKHKKGGFLKIEARGEIAFFQLQKNSLHAYRNAPQTRIGRIVTAPYRWLSGIYRYFRRGFRRGDWRLNFYRLKEILPRPQTDETPFFKGYIAFNQPKYRPGDTLRMKAFLTAPKGKAWKKDVQLQLSNSYYSKEEAIIDSLISANSPGNYTFETILDDSLAIDKNYYAFLRRPGRKRRDPFSQSFYLEDYQLDETVYTLQCEKKIFFHPEEIGILAEAKDQNGLPVPDTEVQIVAKAGYVDEFWEDEVWIQDTLWRYTQALSSQGESRIIFPDSLLPPASMRITLSANFRNSKGELQTKNAQFTIRKGREQIRVWEEDGFILARYFVNGEERPLEVDLEEENEQLDWWKERRVQLPFREKIDPNVQNYRFSKEALETEWKIQYHENGLQASGYHTRDSVFVRMQNPKKIPFTYRIGPRSKTAAEGKTDAAYFQWAQPAPAEQTYFLEYQYVWGGQAAQASIPIQFYKNRLQVDLDYLSQATPGETLDFTIKVKDSEKRPLKNIDLTAGATNAQFGGKKSYSSPGISYRLPKSPRTFNKFELNEPYLHTYSQDSLTGDWGDKLQLKKQLFYRLRYSGEGLYMEYNSLAQDTFHRQMAQFAPYVVRRGRSQAVILIYCNRQLVYYYDLDDRRPYSFTGLEGYNSLVVRTPEYEYIIDSVWLEKGRKLEIAIDEDRYRFDPMAGNIYRKAVPKRLTASEKALLNRRIFMLDKQALQQPVFVWQDSFHIHRIQAANWNEPIKLGPFRDGDTLHFQKGQSWKTEFVFESGYKYVVEEKREKLYRQPLFSSEKTHELPEHLKPKASGEWAYTPRILSERLDSSELIRRRLSYAMPYLSEELNGRFRFSFQTPGDSVLLALALLDTDSNLLLLRPSLRTLTRLYPSDYQLFLFTKNGGYIKTSFEAKNNSLRYQNLNGRTWRHDPGLLRRFLSILEEDKKRSNVFKIPRLSQSYDYDRSQAPVYRIEGVIADEAGEPLIGASILIKGTTIGTVTDIDGRYELAIPIDIRSPEIIVSYVGFSSKTVKVEGARMLDVRLDESAMHLEEIVVTGLGTVRRQRGVNGLVQIEQDAISGNVAGISIRGSRNNATTYYVDGVRTTDISRLNPSNIQNIEIMEAGKAGIYDLDPSQKVVVISTKREKPFVFSLEQTPSSLRSNFRDYAFWEPRLRTNEKGEAYFKATFPDDLTSWNAFVIAMDGKRRAGLASLNIKSFKPLVAQLAAPRFLIEGDRCNLIGSSVNYTGDSLAVKTSFLLNDKTIQEKNHTIRESLVEKATIEAGKDSLAAIYKLETAAYFDGEQRQIPSLPKGLLQSKGQFWALDQDTAFTYQPNPTLGAVKVYAQGDALSLLLEDIAYLRTYPYECNEQTASRLIALLLEKDIRKKLKQPFKRERAIRAMIDKLKKAQNEDGSWGWWPGNSANDWMTAYVLRALHRADDIDDQTAVLEKGLRYLTSRLHRLPLSDRMQALELLSEVGQNIDYDQWLAPFDTTPLALSERLRLIRIQQLQGRPLQLDSLYHYRKESILGGHYWENRSIRRYGEITEPTLLAYRILKRAGKTAETDRIRQYFLETRAQHSRYGWQNTFQTARVLQAILPDIVQEQGETENKKPSAELRLNDEVFTQFPISWSTSAEKTLKLEKNGNLPLFLSAYQQEFNPAPDARDDLFQIRTSLWQNGQKVDQLSGGEKARLVVDLEVKKSAEYLMLEVPVPAGCSYFSKPNNPWSRSSHFEYFKDKATAFFESLPMGKYQFEIELEPRFEGEYTLNPAKVEQMYFPVLSGNNEVDRVIIK